MPSQRIALYALTPQALRLAMRLALRWTDAPPPLPGLEVHAPESVCRRCPECAARSFAGLPALVGELFHARSAHIFVGATGIAVRCIAPHLAGKDRDPAVLVVDPSGSYVISLLSGHLGGANALALRVAELLDARPVISTASDVFGLPALDVLAQQAGLTIGDFRAAGSVAAALAAGEPVFLDDPDDRLGLAGGPHSGLFLPAPPEPAMRTVGGGDYRSPPPTVRVTARPLPARPGLLLLRPPVFAGLGCRRGAGAEDILATLEEALRRADVAKEALAGLASADLKAGEPGLLRAAETLGLAPRFFTPARLRAYPVPAFSPKAMEVLGIAGVCEAAALAQAGPPGAGRLLAGKFAARGVTVALATPRPAIPAPLTAPIPEKDPERGAAPGMPGVPA